MWDATSGDYRFVAGGDDVQSLQQFEVKWKYEAALPQSTAWPLVGLGILFAMFTALGPKRVWDWALDLILVA